jgi:sterol desaturase/sphingolipid hydroxylase (fatty acid hydroxylase superfamily)
MLSLSIIEAFAAGFEEYKMIFKYQISHPSLSNTFYMIPIICLATFLMELYLPRKMDYDPIKRKGFALDLFYVVFFDFLIMVIGFYAFSKAAEYAFKWFFGNFGVTDFLIYDITQLSGIAQFLIIFIVLDFVQWLGHFLLHRVDFLWNFHKIHHAQEELGFASTRHFHWVEYFIFKPFIYVPFILLNVPLSEFLIIYLWIGLSFTFFSHANIKIKWPWFNRIFISPETHYWHHATNLPEERRYGVNFASVLTIWDHLFGYFYYPNKEEKLKPKLGVAEQKRMPSTFIGQMIQPFQAAFGKKKQRAKK